MEKKVSIIGMGNVGSTIAYTVLLKNVCSRLIVTDKNEKLSHAQLLDLQHAAVLMNRDILIEEKKYSEFGDVDLVVFTAAAPLKLGQTRLDMFETSKNIVQDVIPQIMSSGFNGIVLVVTNPVDLVSYLVYKYSGLPCERVIGTGTFLDTLRLKKELAETFKVSIADVSTYVVGEHGDSQVISWSNTKIRGKLVDEIAVENQEIEKLKIRIEDTVKQVGWDIANYKKATTFGIANVTAEIIESIFNNTNKEITLSVLNGNTYSSVPVLVGGTGIQRQLEMEYSQHELYKIKKSKETIKRHLLIE